MKAKEILNYVLNVAMDVEKYVRFEASDGDNFGKYFSSLFDDEECEPGEYFSFWTPDADLEWQKELILRFSEDKIIDYEMPTEDGWWIIMKIED